MYPVFSSVTQTTQFSLSAEIWNTTGKLMQLPSSQLVNAECEEEAKGFYIKIDALSILHVFSVMRHVMSWNPFTASHSNSKEMNRTRPLLCQEVINEIFAVLSCSTLGECAQCRAGAAHASPRARPALLCCSSPTTFRDPELTWVFWKLKPTEFQREQTSSCFLFLNGWTIGLLLGKPWHTRTFPKQTIICLFCCAFLIQHHRGTFYPYLPFREKLLFHVM